MRRRTRAWLTRTTQHGVSGSRNPKPETRNPKPETRNPKSSFLPAKPEVKSLIIERRRPHAERALGDGEFCHQARLGELKSLGRHLRAFEIKLSQRREFLTVTRDHRTQFAATLQRQFALAINLDFKSIQHLRRGQHLVKLRNARLKHVKAALRIDRREKLGNAQLIFHVAII